MRRLLILFFCALFCIQIVEAQDMYKQAESFNRLARNAFSKIEKQSDRDSITIFKTVVDGVEYSLKCDEFDRMPNRKGKILPEYEEENKKRLAILHPMLIDAGKYFYKNHLFYQLVNDLRQLFLQSY